MQPTPISSLRRAFLPPMLLCCATLALVACRPKQPEPIPNEHAQGLPGGEARPAAPKAADKPGPADPATPSDDKAAAEPEYPKFGGTVDKDLVVGIWNGSEALGSGWDDAYLFWPDGRFELRYNQMDCAKRRLAEKGFWTMDNSSAILTVHEERIAVGGELVDSDGSCASDKMLEGATESSRTVEPPRADRIDLSNLEKHPDLDTPILKVGKRRFHKKGWDPEDY